MSAETYRQQLNAIDREIASLNARIANLQKQIAQKKEYRVRVSGYLQRAEVQEKKH